MERTRGGTDLAARQVLKADPPGGKACERGKTGKDYRQDEFALRSRALLKRCTRLRQQECRSN